MTQETRPPSTKQCLLIQLVVANRLRTQNIFTVLLTMSVTDYGDNQGSNYQRSTVYNAKSISHFGNYNLIGTNLFKSQND